MVVENVGSVLFDDFSQL